MAPRPAVWRCPVCNAQLLSRRALTIHLDRDHSALERATAKTTVYNSQFPRICSTCHQVFYSAALLLNHQQRLGHWRGLSHQCNYCHRRFETPDAVRQHTATTHFHHYSVRNNAFRRTLETVERIFGPDENDVDSVDQVFVREEAELMQMLRAYINQHQAITAHIVLSARMVLYDDEGEVVERFVAPLRTNNHNLLQQESYNPHNVLQEMRSEANTRLEELEMTGSGYSLERIVGISLDVAKVVYAGGAYATDTFSSVLKDKEKNYCIDVASHIPNGCLFAAVVQGFLRQEIELTEEDCVAGGDRFEQTKKFVNDYLCTKNMPTPTPLSKLATFEKNNARKHLHFSLNVFMMKLDNNRRSFFPVHISQKSRKNFPGETKFINLLLIRAESGKMHYIFIRDLDKLINSASSMGKKEHNKKSFYKTCVNCLQRFSSADVLTRHQHICFSNDAQAVKMPCPGTQLHFKNYSKQIMNPIIGFADFEASMRKRSQRDENVTAGGGDGPSTTLLTDQLPTTFALLFLDSRGNILYQRTYSSDTDLLETFFETLFQCEDLLMPLLCDRKKNVPILTPDQADAHRNADTCYLCHTFFTDPQTNPKVIDHSHSSLDNGAYLGAAHNECNLARREQKTIPIFMHNFCSYDSAFLCQGLSNSDIVAKIRRISAIPLNTEKFKTMRINCYSFLDSLAFLNNSLANLVTELKDSNHNFPLLDKFSYLGKQPNCDKELLVRKSVYPYDWSTSIEKLTRVKEFPPKEAFFNVLTETNISDLDYEHGMKMYSAFECRDFLDYCEVYCLLDVFLLAETVCAFRQQMHRDFGLDMSHYMSSPAFSFDVMLKESGVKLDLISDPEMLLLIESGLRGGVSFVGTRHVKLAENFDPNVTPECLLYIDICNLYGKCMSDMSLPTSNFRWLSSVEMRAIDWSKQDRCQNVGYIVECDLSIPVHLHKKFAAMPLAQEKYKVDVSELSDYSAECQRVISGDGKNRPSAEKLCGTFHPKKNFVVHYVNLKHFLAQGMILDKIHRVISFTQSPFLSKYLKIMSEKRRNADSDFKRAIIKLLINSIYGKLIECVRRYQDVKFVTKPKWLNRYLTDPCYTNHKILGENCVVFYRKKKSVVLDKAYAAGFSILELSKNLMSTLYYGFIQKHIGVDNLDVVMSDTDSYILHITNHTKYETLKKLTPIMDFSNYSPDHPLFNGTHRKMIPGFFKDETPNCDIVECIALRSKCYITRTKKNLLSARCKGIAKRVVKKFTIENYRACLLQMSKQYASMRRIRSKNHILTTIEVRKISLSSYDQKRHIFSCGIHSAPFGSIYISNDSCPRCDHVVDELIN